MRHALWCAPLAVEYTSVPAPWAGAGTVHAARIGRVTREGSVGAVAAVLLGRLVGGATGIGGG
ncbi:hypothetical protein, partial [Dietzia sp. HMSC21D01]